MRSEVRVEGVETLNYLDHLQEKERITEQADAITFESEVTLSELSLLFLRTPILFMRLSPGKEIPNSFSLTYEGNSCS